ncbi:response regulator [Brevundimonas lenta]|uniref:CheY-like chemotaxis protein n=1 Tax=Brevundimonas lenta TaxID=424796 RepID=A0A7W6JD38_9CAUL|nr:response regulator [Brevundimonas lenta]MBB4081942.1 CheY-like chemotaxis protein [Brevundimonas lenta]
MKPLSLLHVDDDDDIRDVAAMSLELDPTIDLTSAASGEEALDLLSAGLRPDVILLDVMMPRLDGPGTLEGLRRIAGLEDTPVIFMTARTQGSEVQQWVRLGAVGVITKPFDPMTLAGQVRDVLSGA